MPVQEEDNEWLYVDVATEENVTTHPTALTPTRKKQPAGPKPVQGPVTQPPVFSYRDALLLTEET